MIELQHSQCIIIIIIIIIYFLFSRCLLREKRDKALQLERALQFGTRVYDFREGLEARLFHTKTKEKEKKREERDKKGEACNGCPFVEETATSSKLFVC